MPSSTPRPRALRRAALLALCLAACRDGASDVPPATMVPTPIEGASPGVGPAALPVVGGGCARLALCCAQVMGASGGGAQPGCAQIASVGGSTDAERACDAAARSLAASAHTFLGAAPACGGAGGIPSGVALRGAPAGRASVAAAGVSFSGTLEAGDSLTSEGSAYDDYVLPLVGGRPVTIVARGGPLASGGGSLDMYITLLSNGTEVTHDDDSAGSLNSRIVYTAPSSGVYVLRVSTFGTALHAGTYNLELYDGALPNQS